MIRAREKTKVVYFDVDWEFSEWMKMVSKRVGVTKEHLVKEAIESWMKGDIQL